MFLSLDEMKKIISLWRYCVITFQRGFDHAWRKVFGLPQRRRSLITPSLYVGGQYRSYAVDDLQRLGITGVVNMRMHSIHKDIKGLKLRICNLPTPDYCPPTQENLTKGVAFIQKEIDAGGKVYIHCRLGEGRGPTMAIAYLISTGLVYDDAYALVKKVRPFINPTEEQIEAVKKFEAHYCKKH